MAVVRWTDEALNDLDNIASYISKDSPQDATKVVNQIVLRVKRLKRFPQMGRIFLKNKTLYYVN